MVTALLLEVRDLTKRFAGVRAVDGVSFTVARGRIHAVIGPNGAGKTTLFNLITGFETPTSGEIRLDGRRVTGLPPHRLAALGVGRTFQTPQVCADVTAIENVMLGAHLRLRRGPLAAMLRLGARGDRELRAEAAELLALVGLETRGDVMGRALAYGELKRLEIARALAARPRLLCLDEPAAGLDPRETAELGDLIRRIAESGVTVVLVEHDMRLVMSLSEHVVVLSYGRKLAEGPPEEVGDYIASYRERYGQEPSTFGGYAYDALMIAVRALETAGTDRARLRDAIEQTSGWVGTQGTVTMSPTDHIGLRIESLRIVEVRDGDWALVE